MYFFADRPGDFTRSERLRQVTRSTLPIQAGRTCRFAQADTQDISRSIACLALPVWISKPSIRRHQLRAAFGDDSKIVSPFKETVQITLLVDGDYFGSAQISEAIAYLSKRMASDNVNTLIFGAPGAIKNKSMMQLLQQLKVSFVPVPRGQSLVAEPNDDAIISKIQECALSTRCDCIVLLTNDKGFADVLKHVIVAGSPSTCVIIPNRNTSVVNFYKEQGIPVLTLPAEERFTKIRAILHADGDGTVEFGEDIDAVAHWAEAEVMYNSWEEMLKSQACPAAFSSADAYPIQRIAKFWFANGLGSLPVFPVPLAVSALDHAIRFESRNWISNSQAFAFALPVRRGKVTKKQLETYGSNLARGIFRGGGPFILEDSSDLVAHFLHKLGYLDDTWNSDFTEALNCFWNASGCKGKLRKLGVQLDTHETTARAAAKLRTALLSDSCNGHWQPGGTSMPAVINVLQRKSLLSFGSESPAVDEVWCAMKTYAEVHGLPRMKTLNLLAAHILEHADQKDPLRRGKIEIA